MGHSTAGLNGDRHKKLVASSDNGKTETIGTMEWEDGSKPTVAFTDDYIRIGCKKISRNAWLILDARYEPLPNRERFTCAQRSGSRL